MALATLIGRKPQGIFIPYRYAAAIRPPETYASVEAVLSAAAPTLRKSLVAAAAHRKALMALGGKPPAPRWDQDWFPGLDAAFAYVLVRERRPRLIVEIGSGHSTRFIARAIADQGLAARHVAIDPAPRAAIAGLGVEQVRAVAQGAPRALFEALRPGDMLFVDSSHILHPGSDVDFVLSEILPAAPAGLLVHFHDVFLPDAYPADWAWRGYNEQNAIAPLIVGGILKPLWASHYARTRMADAVRAAGLDRLTLIPGARESSLWVEKS